MTLFWVLLIAVVVLRPLRRWSLAFWPVTIAAIVAFCIGVRLANWAEGLGLTRDWPIPLSIQCCFGVICAVAAGQWAFGLLGFLVRPPQDSPTERDNG